MPFSGFYNKPIYTVWNSDFSTAAPGIATLPRGFSFERDGGATVQTSANAVFTSQWKTYPYSLQTTVSASQWGSVASVAFNNATKITVCGWVKLSTNTNAAVLYETNTVWTAGGFGLFQNGNASPSFQSSLYIAHSDVGSHFFGGYTANQPTGVWLRFCHTIDCSLGTNQGKLYINGVVQPLTIDNNTVATSIPTAAFNLWMRNAGTAYPYYGSLIIDFIKIGKAYTDGEAALDYQYGCVTGGTTLTKWDFNQGSGTTVVDSSGNGFNITLHNSPTWSTDVPAVTTGIATNVPRIGNNGIQRGFVFEEGRTNSIPDTDLQATGWLNFTAVPTLAYVTSPDGDSTAIQVTDSNNSAYTIRYRALTSVLSDGTAFVAFAWHKWISGAIGGVEITGDGDYLSLGSFSGNWEPLFPGYTTVAANHFAQIGCDPALGSPSNTTNTGSAAYWAPQIQAGKFQTEIILTKSGSAVRSGERLYRPTGNDSIDAGTLNLEWNIFPKGNSGSYSSPMRLWSDSSNGNSYIEVSNTNGSITCSLNGTIAYFPTGMTWSILDQLRIYTTFGNNQPTELQFKVNNGPTKKFPGPLFPASVFVTGSSEFLCSGSSKQFTSYISSMAAYKKGQKPNWCTGSAWIPNLIGSSVKAWYRADLGITIATGVSQWNDQSGNGRHLIQSTGSKQPTLVTASFGLPAVRFDGSNDYMFTSAFGLGQPFTVFIVYKSVTIGAAVTNDVIFDGTGPSVTTAIGTDTVPRSYLFAGNALVGSQIASSSYVYAEAVFNGASSFLLANGSTVVSGDAGAQNPDGFTLGAAFTSNTGTRNTNIEVAEVIILNVVPTTDQTRLIENYLRARYVL